MTAMAIDTPSRLADPRVLQAGQGDLEAFNSLVLEHERRVYAICYRLIGSREAAEDAAQETFLAAWRHISRVNPGSFRPWLYRIAVNASRTYLRNQRRRPESSLDEISEPEAEDPTPETAAVRREAKAEIASALGKLSDHLREAIVLRHEAGLDYQQIALITGTSLGTVKTRIFRGRKQLAETLTRRFFAVA